MVVDPTIIEFLTRLLRHVHGQSADLAFVRSQLGHSSIQVTVDIYGHLVPGANRDEVGRLDDAPTRNPPRPR